MKYESSWKKLRLQYWDQTLSYKVFYFRNFLYCDIFNYSIFGFPYLSSLYVNFQGHDQPIKNITRPYNMSLNQRIFICSPAKIRMAPSGLCISVPSIPDGSGVSVMICCLFPFNENSQIGSRKTTEQHLHFSSTSSPQNPQCITELISDFFNEFLHINTF